MRLSYEQRWQGISQLMKREEQISVLETEALDNKRVQSDAAPRSGIGAKLVM